MQNLSYLHPGNNSGDSDTENSHLNDCRTTGYDYDYTEISALIKIFASLSRLPPKHFSTIVIMGKSGKVCGLFPVESKTFMMFSRIGLFDRAEN
jgi:hypothetical protein